jgi:hypothetical protein
MDNKNIDEARKQTLLFAQLIEILTQNAVLMLGGAPDRQGRQRPPDLNGAEMMIDMLSVLYKKTKSNLTPEEEKMISGTLFQLQTAFADVASKSGEFEKARKATEASEAASEPDFEDEQFPEPPPSKPSAQGHSHPTAPKNIQPSVQHASETKESKVKFAKKYS